MPEGMARSFYFCAFIPLLFCAFIFVSCADEPPIPQKDFAELYVQLQLFNVQYATRPSIQKAKTDSLLKAFKVNDSLVSSTLSWYSRKPERWHKFFSDVQNRLNKIKPADLRKKP
jgi:Domain of unknown function (DUF4296)